jgi:hypothetical protein
VADLEEGALLIEHPLVSYSTAFSPNVATHPSQITLLSLYVDNNIIL